MRRTLWASYAGIYFGLTACSAAGPLPDGREQGRVHEINAPVRLESDAPGVPGSKPESFSGSKSQLKFNYVAAVDAPKTSDGRTLQASSFAVRGDYGYTAYMMAGPDVSGALDVMDLSNPDHPKVLSTTRFPTAEFTDIQVVGTTAYLVGAHSDVLSGATLDVVNVADPARPIVLGPLQLPGHVATSISASSKGAFVTTGDNGGLVELAFAPNSTKPTIVSTLALPNALFVRSQGDRTYVLSGSTSTTVTTVRGGKVLSTAIVSSQPVPAPARMRRYQNGLVINAEQTGLTLVDLNGKVPAQHAAMDGTGNGVDITGSLGIFAQGEAGTSVYDLTSSVPVSLGKFAFPDERGSANNVHTGRIGNSKYIFLSDGLGGFRIVSFVSDSAGSEGKESDDTDDEKADRRQNEGDE